MSDKKYSFHDSAWMRVVGTLIGCIVLFSYGRFFLLDPRPFIDHASHYICDGYFSYMDILYEMLRNLLESSVPSFQYDGFFLYRCFGVFLMGVLIFFVHRTVRILYGQFAACFAVLFISTFPEILNVFHKTEVNSVILSLSAVSLYLYVKSSAFRDRAMTVLFFFSAFFMFIYHHSSLLYLLCMVCVFFVSGLKTNNASRKNAFIGLGVFLVLLLVDRFLNSARYDVLLERILFYFTHHNVFCKDVSGTAGGSFLSSYTGNFSRLYNLNLKWIDFHFMFAAAVFSFESLRLLRKKYRREILSENDILTLHLILFSLGGMLFILLGFSDIKKFFTPFCVVLTVICSRFFIDAVDFLKTAVWGRILIGLFFVVFSGYAFLMLFLPSAMFESQNDTLESYRIAEDDFNLMQVVDFLLRQDISENDLTVTHYNYFSAGDAELFLISVFLKMKWEWGYIIPEDKTFNVCFYDLQANDFFSRKEPLADIERKVRQRMIVQESVLSEDFSERPIVLKRIIPYGVFVEQEGVFSTAAFSDDSVSDVMDTGYENMLGRQYLLFIYAIGGDA